MTTVFTECDALKTEFTCLILRVLDDCAELIAPVLELLLTLPQLKLCVKGVTRVCAKQANRLKQAVLFLVTGLDRQRVQPTKPIGYDSRIAKRQERVATAAAAAVRPRAAQSCRRGGAACRRC